MTKLIELAIFHMPFLECCHWHFCKHKCLRPLKIDYRNPTKMIIIILKMKASCKMGLDTGDNNQKIKRGRECNS